MGANEKTISCKQRARDRSDVIRMVKYVRGSQYDKWHWCKNCTQYPMYIYQETPIKPPSDFCEQCRTKEKTANCQCEELKTAPERQSKSDFIDFRYNNQYAL
jgi:hypothetical protein